MKKFIIALMVAACALGALSSVAHAATITTAGAEVEELNIETQGSITFEAPFIRVVCEKTISGKINARTEGTLGLPRGNEAGIIRDVRLAEARCRGGTATSLIRLADATSWVNLWWVRAEPAPLRAESRATLAGTRARFRIEALGLRCLYTADLTGEGAGIRITRISLRLLGAVTLVEGPESCPRSGITINGALTLTKPAAGIEVILR
jgi:hypothetical protein